VADSSAERLRAGVDATAWANPRGDGRFVRNAVARLVALHPEIEWTLYADAGADGADLPRGAAVRRVAQRRPPADALATGAARSVSDVLRLTRSVSRRDLDVFLSPSVYSYFPVLGVPTVVGLHDLNSITHPELVLPGRRDRALWKLKQAVALRRAARLFTVSEASRDAIADRLGIAAQRIAVVPEAADPIFEPQSQTAVDAALRELGLSRAAGYFVFAAGISPHKGLDTLLGACALLRSRRAVPPLVVAGSLEGPYASAGGSVARIAEELGLGPESLRLPGFVSDRDLAALYSGAAAAVVPSLAEGFGLAAVEAAACGAPVIASDIGPHREALGDSGLFFEPGNAAALAARLGDVADAGEGRDELGRRARAAAERLSWDETARRLGALLLDAAGR
jgi:glycosyltransferase involved in cell wall biosynthesis